MGISSPILVGISSPRLVGISSLPTQVVNSKQARPVGQSVLLPDGHRCSHNADAFLCDEPQ